MAPILAATVVSLARVLGWAGVDLPAQVFRVDAIKTEGLRLWDFQWYGGHWTLNYSVIFPSVASVIGLTLTAVASAAAAAFAFDRLARQHFGRSGRLASIVFAVGTVVPAAIGQLPFLAGVAFGLWACWAAQKRWWVFAALFAVGATLCSPLAGLFVGLAIGAWGLSVLPKPGSTGLLIRIGLVGLAAVAPIAITSLLFPGQGDMPYPFFDYSWEMAVAIVAFVVTFRDGERPLFWGTVLFMVLATAAFLVPSPLGGNVGRIEDAFALPLAVAVLWDRWRLLLSLVAFPLVLSQWSPAWAAMTKAPDQPSTHQSFYAPLITALRHYSAGGPAGRVEVVPTAFHWEAAYVAAVMPLARGWERQLDVSENPVFYKKGELNPESYETWLLNNGVRFVALPNAPLDFAGIAEGKLVSSGTVPDLHEIWQTPDWRLYAVDGSPGIVSGPANLVSASGDSIVAQALSAGQVLIRVRYSPDWRIDSGVGCISEAQGSWISVAVPEAEQFSLRLSLFGAGSDSCPAGVATLTQGS